MALDEPKDNDATFDQDGLKFVVDNGLLTSCGSIKVDFINAGMRSGFSISSTIPVNKGSSCGSSCGTNCG